MPCQAHKVLYVVASPSSTVDGSALKDVDLSVKAADGQGAVGVEGPQADRRSDHATISNFETRPPLGHVTMDLVHSAICSSPLHIDFKRSSRQ